jgi:thioredoxin-like negative regulator of GroEL
MAPVVAEVALENRNTFAFAKLDMDENLETVRKYKPNGHPVYIVFQDGKDVGRFRGEMPKDVLVKRILSVIDVEEN